MASDNVRSITADMNTKYYLAVDIGASSGRHILSHMEDGRIVLEEIYRFSNACDIVNGHRVWDIKRLFRELINGMKKCAETGKIPLSMGIDSWAVDYVLLDKDDEMIGPCYAYRDTRTEGMDEEVSRIIPLNELYARTGIQKAAFNTIYQLMADKKNEAGPLDRAESFLMIPDYLNFLLTGVKKQEYTNASTTQLLSAAGSSWDYELIDLLGYPKRLFKELSLPGTSLGRLLPAIKDELGFDTLVILPATHDTASAVMSLPSNEEDVLYISSGTWSLMGCELLQAISSDRAQKANFTNEGGYDHRYRFLKNIMGLWMIQSVKKELEEGYEYEGRAEDEDYGFAHLCSKAELETIDSLIDADDERFLAPDSMIGEIRRACAEAGMQIPESPWQLARVIYRSLAVCYKNAAAEIEAITGKSFNSINIVGGGSNADWLNSLTAQLTGKMVFAGPSEASAVGNLGAQMIADGSFKDLKDFRNCVFRSFEAQSYDAAGLPV